ncbi:cation transporter [Vitreimonas sp.]|uniref:cation transporter n=1 Tax=Vitreimonas sp. TaxID=3069702 RepID=UPI002EDB744F
MTNTASAQRSTLWIVLALNLALAAGLAVAGVSADSSALTANALDNASDAVVYGISLFAIGRAPIWKQRAAHWSAALLLIFGLGVAADALRRFITGSEPIGLTMMAMAAIAAVVNLVCFFLLRRLKSDDVNLEAAETFSLNDFASNGGVLVAGALVLWLDQRWPDLLVGALVALIAIKGSIDIWRSARRDQAGEQTER